MDGLKTCGKCRRALPVSGFGRNASRSDGLQSQCHTCKRATQSAWYRRNTTGQQARNARQRERNMRHLWTYLSTHPCIDCGEADPVVLEFDHVRGEKTRALSDMSWRGFSLERIEAEIAKCEVRCANCHRRRTATDQAWCAAVVGTHSPRFEA